MVMFENNHMFIVNSTMSRLFNHKLLWGGSVVKNLLVMQEMWVGSLGWKDPWRRKWQPTPVSLLGKSHGQRSLAGYMTWSCKVGYNLVTKLPPPFL